MSLHDVSKNRLDRSNPAPNTHDTIIDGAVRSHKTISTHYNAGADTNPGFLQMQNKQIIGSDGTTPITLYGYNQALGKWGSFVTQPGVDVTTNTDLSKFIFNSNQDIFKIVQVGSGSTPAVAITDAGSGLFNTNTATTTIAHDLGYAPVVVAYLNVVANYIPIPYTILDATNGTGIASWVTYSAAVDSTNVYLTTTVLGIHAAVNKPQALIKYYLLQESLS